MAWLRTEELLKAGRHSLGGVSTFDVQYRRLHPDMMTGIGVSDANRATLDKLYPQLRAEANAWSRSRDQFMNARFQRGRHPDWDPHFWDGWKPAKAPDFKVSWFSEKASRRAARDREVRLWKLAQNAIMFGAVTLFAVLWFRARKRRGGSRVDSSSSWRTN